MGRELAVLFVSAACGVLHRALEARQARNRRALVIALAAPLAPGETGPFGEAPARRLAVAQSTELEAERAAEAAGKGGRGARAWSRRLVADLKRLTADDVDSRVRERAQEKARAALRWLLSSRAPALRSEEAAAGAFAAVLPGREFGSRLAVPQPVVAVVVGAGAAAPGRARSADLVAQMEHR